MAKNIGLALPSKGLMPTPMTSPGSALIYPSSSLKQEIVKLLEEFTKKNSKYKEDDSVIVAVLSHGEEENGKHILHNYHHIGYSYLSLARFRKFSRIHHY